MAKKSISSYTFSNDTLTTLTLYNLTEEDSGLYTCIAIGPYSDHSGNVDLFVESTYIRSNIFHLYSYVNVRVGQPFLKVTY